MFFLSCPNPPPVQCPTNRKANDSFILERSNVDITEELVNLITAQRNFQANAKTIETNTSLTQAIIQIRT